MADPSDPPDSDDSSNLYDSNDNAQLHRTDSPPDLEQVNMDLSSDDSDSGVVLGHNMLPQRSIGSTMERKASHLASQLYTPNGHNLKSPPPIAPGNSGEVHAADTAQRKRKWSNEIGYVPPPISPGFARHQAMSSDGEVVIQTSTTTDLSSHKRARLRRTGLLPDNSVASVPWDRSMLPDEIWQHVFTFVPPAFLGRLLRVNRVFKTLLTPKEMDTFRNKVPHGSLKFQAPNSVWIASRKYYCPGMPRPLSSFTEQEMWSLLRGLNCQFCDKPGPVSPPLSDTPWEAGPGSDGVRIVWPFGIRCCGGCLMERTEKEMDLMFSSSMPSMLLPALPFSFLTQSLNVVSSTVLRISGPPPGTRLVKYFFKPHIEEIKQKLDEVKSMGPATAEEWVKGLEISGKEKLADSARWEQWEANGGLRALNSRHIVKAEDSESRPKSVLLPAGKSSGQIAAIREPGSGQSTPNTTGKSANDSSSASPARMQFPQGRAISFSPKLLLPVSVLGMGALTDSVLDIGNGLPPRPSSPPSRNSFPFPFPNHQPQQRVERSIKDINEAKASRRAEIERRCQELDPPLSATVLTHMESFQAAMHIPKPLTQSDWEVLKPRLLAQREIAEHRENERMMQYQLLQIKTEERRNQEAQLKEAKESLDRDWEDVQKPIRDRLGSYADEIIRDKWSGGESVTKDKCSKFAAEVLMYVRDRFYADVQQGDQSTMAAGNPPLQDSPNAPPRRKIILENMKWVFDTKIKPLTEPHQKELFLCNACESNNKFYGFEGVVQHYAAKHTNVLSMGSVVVHWRSEWPDPPPFNPNPSIAKHSYYGIQTPSMAPASTVSGIAMSQSGAYMPGSEQGAMIYPQPSPGPYGRPAYPTHYSYGPEPYKPTSPDLHSGPYQPPPLPYQLASQNGYGYPQAPNYGFAHVHGVFPGQYQPPQPHIYGSPYPGQVYPAQMPMSDSMPTQAFPAPIHYGPQPQTGYHAFPPQAQPIPISNPPVSGPPLGFHQIQLDELAKNARDIWDGTSGIKDIPGNVRTYVIIQHVVLRFKDKYTNEPNLALFTDGLNNHAQMRPLRSINALTCKACATGLNDPNTFQPHPQPPHGEKKLYTLPALLSHFQSVHVERAKPAVVPQTGIETPRLDWKFDMIELPDSVVLLDLIHSLGMDDAKLKLIAQAIKGVFPSPLPKVVPALHAGPVPVIKEEVHPLPSKIPAHTISARTPVPAYRVDSRPLSPQSRHSPSPRMRGLEITLDRFGTFVESPMREPSLPDTPREDEYDPHRPAPLQPIVASYGRGDYRRFQTKRSPLTSEFLDEQVDQVTSGSRGYERRPANSSADTDHQRYRIRPSEILRSYGEIEPRRLRSPDYVSSSNVSTYGHEPRRVPQPREDFSPRARHTEERLNPAPGAGSEDGEVTRSIQREHGEARPKEPANEQMTDAERFLNNFVPGSEVEDAKVKQGGFSNAFGQENNSRSNWGGETAEEERRRYAAEGRDSQAWKVETNLNATAENSAQGTPMQNAPSNGWGSVRKSPVPASTTHTYEYDPEHPRDGLRLPSERPIDQSPEYDPRQHIRNSAAFQEAPRPSADHHARRPHSRFDRYEAQRQPSVRVRSKSPNAREPSTIEPTYHYRERSPPPRQPPRQVYYAQSPDAHRDRHAIDEPITYTRVPSQSYQYVEEPRYVDAPSADRRPIQYIEVREQPQGYYIERPVQREYVRYDGGEYAEQPQYYRVAAPRGQGSPERQDSLPRTQYRYR